VGHEATRPPDARLTAPRPSAAEREWVIRRLRSNCAADRISLDTFAARVDVAYATKSRSELVDLIADLPDDRLLGRALLDSVAWLSWWTARLRAAWRRPRTPRLVLPVRTSVVVGRSRDCGCVLRDTSVSRRHALLRHVDGSWWLRDLGSTNGTYVNGSLVVEDVEVGPGDVVGFGAADYQLVRPRAVSCRTDHVARSAATHAA
jgi:hypothetical protein